MRTITIEIHDGNDFTIIEGDRSCDKLCWDEMLGTIAELTHPKVGEARYRMRTAEEQAEWDAKYGPKPVPPVFLLEAPQ